MGLSTTYTKTETDFLIQQRITTAYLGIATTTTKPPATGAWWYKATEAGTYTNFLEGGSPIEVTSADLDGNMVFLEVKDNVAKKVVVELPTTDLSKINDILFFISDHLDYSPTISSNANAVNLSAINNVVAGRNGIIKEISGRFPASGVLTLFIANNKTGSASPFTFTIKKIFTVTIPNVGKNTVDISAQKIAISQGERIGVAAQSAIKPYYGIDNSLGFGWYQNALTLTEGTNSAFSEVTNASFAVGFSVQETIVSEKNDVYSKSSTDTLLLNKASKSDIYTNYKLYELPTNTGTAVSALLGNNVEVTKTGYISKLKIRASTAGTMTFQIFERLTFNADAPAKTDVFKAKKTFSVEVTVGFSEYSLSEKILVNKGEILTIVGGATVYPVINNAAGLSHLGWWQGSAGAKTEGSNVNLIYQKGTILFEYWIDEIIYQGIQPSIKINKITAVQNAENYNSIRNLVNSIADASEQNQYEIFIPAGTWNEYDWKGKKHIKLIGALNGETIINLDPLGTMASFVAPSDLHFATEVGKTLNNVVQLARHIIFVKEDIHCENLTFKAKDSKYPIHIDYPGFQKAYFKNCIIIEDTCNHAIGMGIWAGQNIVFDQCIIESKNSGKIGFFYHNWNNQLKGNMVTFNRCKFDNCSYGNIDELGSNQVDMVNIFDCFTTLGTVGQKLNFMVDKTSGGTTFWKKEDNTNEANPVNVPYCIVLNTTGTKLTTLTVSDSSTFNPMWTGIPQRDIEVIKKLSIIEI